MRKIVGFCVSLSLFVFGASGANGQEDAREILRREVIERAGDIPDIIGPQPGDQAKDLVDHYKIWNLRRMEEQKLMKAELPVSPWTDSYWPTYAGGIANRYGDPRYNAALSWKENEPYLRKMLGKGADLELSPAEKYDLLVGDASFTLTNSLINSSAAAAGPDGEVESWFGLCHGWAAASFMLPRPRKSVSVRAADGRKLTFTPSDIKALATLLWANARAQTKFVGGRCNEKDPGRENGREIDPECFDNNPATWHLAVVNQVGIAKRSLVLDLEEGYEVWNQPVFSYSYGYENPVTGKAAGTLAEAKVSLREYRDPYQNHRSPQAKSVVNIFMTVDYISETDPSLAGVDGPENDIHRLVAFAYDLELDENDNIVGGEWHSANHPDFLWVPVSGSRAYSAGDEWLFRSRDNSSWVRGYALPGSWVEAAKASSLRQQPLAKIVEALLNEASL